MKIVVIDIAASSGGALTVIKDFYQYIENSNDTNEWYFVLSGPYLQETPNVHIIIDSFAKKNRGNRLLFDLFLGRKVINRINPNVVFSLENTLVLGCMCKEFLYVHQTVPFQQVKKFSFFKKEEFKTAIIQYLLGFMIKFSITLADGVIVQTTWLKNQIKNSIPRNKEKVHQVIPTIEIPELANLKRAEFNKKRFFYPGSNIIYKNNQCILDATRLLLQKYHDFSFDITLDGASPLQNVNFIGKIPREEVFSRYVDSTLVFPSYIESFGYPLAEARAVGGLILASDMPFSHEILDGYDNAYFFDPFKPEELAKLIAGVLSGGIIKREIGLISEKKENSWGQVVNILVGQGW